MTSPGKQPKVLLRQVGRLTTKAEEAKRQRDEMIRVALQTCSVRQVAAAAGLSPARVQQIRNES